MTGNLPSVLVDPQWGYQNGYFDASTVVSGLVTTAPDGAQWLPGEQAEWAATWLNWPAIWEDPSPVRLRECAALMASGKLRGDLEAVVLTRGEADQVLPLLATWKPRDIDAAALWMRVVIARFGPAAIPAVLKIAKKSPTVGGELLQPLVGQAVAELMADWLTRLLPMRPVARGWLKRHPGAAAAALIPAAVGEFSPARLAAEEALRILADSGYRDLVLQAASCHGDAALAAVSALLVVNRFDCPPAFLPKPPKWLNLEGLPPVLTRGGQPLPVESARMLCAILGSPEPDDMRERIPRIEQSCDDASLARFGWALLERWEAGKAPAKCGWVVTAVGLLGNEETVRRLVERIVGWADSGFHARAVRGLEALGAMGTDVALMHVERLSRTSKFKKLKSRAQELLSEIAKARQLTADELADRVVPDFGLDASGSLVLDYGPRRFTVGFDEQLKPWVADEKGNRRALLPRPAAADDPALAPAAYERFAGLKKDVKAIAAGQLRRLEQAMVSRRSWSVDEFQRLIVDHPLLWHISRRLVWATVTDNGGLERSFRVAEDRSFAGSDDEEFALSPRERVGIAHPIHLAGEVADWSEIFSDYEILQPFPQLSRGVFALRAGEAELSKLSRFDSIEVATGKVLGMRSRGWSLEVSGGGEWDSVERVVGSNRVVRFSLSPGIPPYYVSEHPKQQISNVRIAASAAVEAVEARFGDLDPLTLSEILRDLTDLTN